MNKYLTCCENKIYLSQIIQSVKGKSPKETNAKLTLFDYFVIAFLSLMEQSNKNCSDCKNTLNELVNDNFEIGSRTVGRMIKKANLSKEINKDLKDEETFLCLSCWYKEDRDINAAKNILWKAQVKLGLNRLGTSSSERI